MRAIIHAESAYNPNALSRVGAQGLMQLMPATARRFGVGNAFDAGQNIRGGVQYLAWLLKRFNGDLTLAAAGYNAGEGAVDKYKGVPPYSETQRYVQRVACSPTATAAPWPAAPLAAVPPPCTAEPATRATTRIVGPIKRSVTLRRLCGRLPSPVRWRRGDAS